MSDFIHLHVHSHYSVLDGIMKVDELVRKTHEFGQPAVALTDHGNMFGAFEFFKTATGTDKAGKPWNVKPIYGAELYVAPKSRFDKDKTEKYYHIVLLAKDMEGYKNLIKLASIGYLEGFYYKPRVDHDTLKEHSKGLVALSACVGGEVPRMILDGNEKGLQAALDFYTGVFGKENFFLELQDHRMPEEKIVNARLLELSGRTGLGLVATNDAHYVEKEDALLQEIAFAIQDKTTLNDPKRRVYPSDEFFLKRPEEMDRLFAGLETAVSNTKLISEMCDVKLVKSDVKAKTNMHTPLFPLPEGETAITLLEKKSREGLAARFKGGPPEEYKERLETETLLIQRMGFSDYFLIVSDFVRFARDSGILVGPGRGSAAGALLSYSLGITDVDPIRYSLLFERFLNPERVSMPDIDIDFQDDRRDEVKEYIRTRYGYQRTADVITFGVMKARASLKDVGRVMEVPLESVNRITKLIDNKTANYDLKDIINGNPEKDPPIQAIPELKELAAKGTPQEKKWIEYSVKLDGTVRNLGTHASALVISDTDLNDVVPLYRDQASGIISTQFEGTHLEDNGLLKMDILGLSNLTMIRDCLERIRRKEGRTLDIFNVALDDHDVYKLFWRGATNGIFQFESEGMTEYLKRLKPTCIDDLIAMNALYRPGPMENIPLYINRKQGKEPVDCYHPGLEPILKPTYGVIVYQEQVMQIAQVMAGFSLGKADSVRRIMSKKKPEDLAKIKPEWLEGSVKNGYARELAEKIFDLLVPFSNYAFNKSHAAAYAILAYQIAWLKTHYPIEFMASLLTLNMGDTDSVKLYCQECLASGIRILPPDVNRSVWTFRESGGKDNKEILFGFGGIKGLGEGVSDAVIHEREMGGDFTSFDNFIQRMLRHGEFKKSAVDVLIKSGAFDNFLDDKNYLYEKAVLLRNLDSHVDQASKNAQEKKAGKLGLFGGDENGGFDIHVNRKVEPLTLREDFENEVGVYGFYLSGKLFSYHRNRIGKISSCNHDILQRIRMGTGVLIWGFISEVLVKKTVQNKPYALLSVDNGRDNFKFYLFSEKYEQFKGFLSPNQFIMLRVVVNEGRKGRQEEVVDIKPVDSVLNQKFTQLHICFSGGDGLDGSTRKTLMELRSLAVSPDTKGVMQMVFHVLNGRDCQVVTASDRYRVKYSQGVMDKIDAIPEVVGYWLY